MRTSLAWKLKKELVVNFTLRFPDLGAQAQSMAHLAQDRGI